MKLVKQIVTNSPKGNQIEIKSEQENQSLKSGSYITSTKGTRTDGNLIQSLNLVTTGSGQ